MLKSCSCCSGHPFAQCCQPFLLKVDNPKTPEQLMRSRFTAFALGGYGEYLLSTWGLAGSMGLSVAELSVQSVNWQGLEIITESQQSDIGYVEFKAVFLDTNNMPSIHHERSKFERVAGRWLYISGEVIG